MPKTTRLGGASKADGTQAPVVERRGGIDFELLGPNADLDVGGTVTIAGDLFVDGSTDIGPAPTTEVDVAEITANTSALSLGGIFVLVAVPGLTVTVPDLAVPVYLTADGSLQASVSATDTIAIAPVGSTALTSAIGGQNITLAAGVGQGAFARARLPAHSPGDYGVFVGGASGTMTVIAAAFSPARLVALTA